MGESYFGGNMLRIKISAAAGLIPLVLFTLNQFILQIFNTAHQELSLRISYAVQPTIYLLYLVAAVIIVFVIMRQLSPLFSYFNNGNGYEKARKSTLKIPWILILVNSGLWVMAITLFYGLQGFNSKGGVPYFWSLTTNSISGALSAVLAALVINRMLIPAKIRLAMTDIKEGEYDLFIRLKIPIVFVTGFIYTILSLIYAARFFRFAAAGLIPPLPVGFDTAIIITALVGAVPVTLNMILAVTEDRIQHKFLLKKMKVLTSGNGDLGNKVSLINFDQTGALAAIINSFIEKIRSLIVKADNTGRLIVSTSNDINNLLTELNNAARIMLEAINSVDNNMNAQEGEINRARNSLSAYFNALADLTDNINSQSESVEQTFKATESIAESIRSETVMVKTVEKQTGELNGITSGGNAHITDFIEAVKAVERSSQVVEEILGHMKSLSEQIDILAMNAAIEAAHAGEAGKGFAVVADEVRRLSENNSEQSNQIAAQMNIMLSAIKEGNSKTDLARNAFQDINNNVEKTSNHFKAMLESSIKEESAVEELMTTVRNLVHITKALETIADAQKKHNEDMKTLIEQVFNRFGGIKHSMNEQREHRNVVSDNLEQMKLITAKNLTAVQELNEILAQFTL